MSPEVLIASQLPALDAFLVGPSLPAVNSVPAAQLDSPFAGKRNRPRAAPATCLDSLSTAQSGQTDQMAALRRSPERIELVERYQAFFVVLARDAHDSLAAIELVLGQPAISSQLIDNLNASIHLRALLTDLFLLSEIATAQRGAAKPMASGG
jgi:hypothetical protein